MLSLKLEFNSLKVKFFKGFETILTLMSAIKLNTTNTVEQTSNLRGLEKIVDMPFGISNRHIHLTTGDYAVLTGKSEMDVVKEVRQPGQFVTSDKFFLEYNGKILQGSRGNSYVGLIGPARGESQVELLENDCEQLDIYNPQTRMSGDLSGTHGIKIIEANSGNYVTLDSGVIIAKNHIHVTPETALEYSLKNGESLTVGLNCAEGIKLFENVEAKVSPYFLDEVHIDQQQSPKNLFSDEQHNTGLVATLFR